MDVAANWCAFEAPSSSELDAWDYSESGADVELPHPSENNRVHSDSLDEDSGDTVYLATTSNDDYSTEVYLSEDNSRDDPVDEPPTYSDGQGPPLNSTPCTSDAAKKQKETDDLEERKALADLLMSDCCKNRCLLHLTGNTILTTRRKVRCLQGHERRKWIIEKITDSSSYINGKLDTKFSVCGTDVCRTAFSQIYGFPPRTLSRAIKSVEQGELIVEHGNKGKKKATAKCEGAKAWIEKYVNLIGDKMPNSKQIHLPCWDTQKDIYSRYKDDMVKQMLDEGATISLSMFYKIWQDDFPHVVIPENNRFAKCDICVRLKMERQESFDKEKKKEVTKARESHMKLVETERKKYHSHREKSRNDPEKYMTIILDGMDQSKTNLPNTSLISKSLSSLWRLRTHITGALIHTRAPHGKLAYAFVDCLQWPHGSNLTLTVLLKSIHEYQKINPLAKNLYMQVDNTCRENKNRFVLSFCAMLVQMDIFQKVQINFLPVGHTHEDIDQLFSKISEEIRKSGCESIPDLINLINRSSTPNPTTFLLDGVWDFKDWLQPHMGVIQQHSRYHVYRFSRNSSGIAEMHYKLYSDHSWLPNEEGIQLSGDQLLKSCPDPNDLLCPSPDKLDLDRLLQDLPKYQKWLTEQSYEHWKLFMSKGKDELTRVNPDVIWPLPVLDRAARRRCTNGSASKGGTLSEETQLLLQKEKAIPKQIIVRHSKRKDTAQTAQSSQSAGSDQMGEPIKEGNLVACYVEKYQDEEPQIAKILNVDTQNVEVHWMQGSYFDSWHPCKVKRGRIYEPWIEDIPRSSILYEVQLSKTNRLSEPLRKKLKSSYSKL